MSNETILNPAGAETVLNPQSAATVLNPSADSGYRVLQAGDTLGERYTVKESLSVSTGEADLYICDDGGKDCVAKVYRRSAAVKPEVVETLKSVRSPWVAPVLDVGTFAGTTFVILPYYSQGSLAGRTFSLDELKSKVIPCINEALHALHQHDVIHKDLKPSNIMMLDDGKGVALIDFGISSILDDGSTVLLTQTGMTPEYSAPETFRGLFLEESDYYSFGVTLYELYQGKTPYKDMASDDIARFIALQRIPFPESMPAELVDLIEGLTYFDITNRNDLKNPNRRWTYEEVAKWCAGTRQPVPGRADAQAAAMSYSFLGEKYEDVTSLAEALAANWDEGKRQLSRGLLSGYFKGIDPELAGRFMDAEEEMRGGDDDMVFWKALYEMAPELEGFYWKGISAKSLRAFGEDVLRTLWSNNAKDIHLLDEVMRNGLVSRYMAAKGYPAAQRQTAAAIESQHRLESRKARERLMDYYLLGYLASGKSTLRVEPHSFADIHELARHMNNLIAVSFESFEEFAHKLIGLDGVLDAQFEAWLIASGHQDKLDDWKKEAQGK